MKLKNLLFVFCLALLAGCQKDPDTESTPVRDTDKVEGVIRMKLDRETAEALNVIRTRSGRVLTGNISFDELCERYNVTGMERLFADNGCAERTRKAGLDLWYIIRFEGSAEQVAEDFGEIAGVNHVEIPRRITKVGGMSRKSGTPWRKLMALPKAAPSNYPFNDPLFGGQWPLYNDGTINANAQAGADINVLPAWEKTAGRSDVIVAVVDEGVEYTHPDLAGNMWSGIGKNFCDRDNDDITWGEGHGTHVAGTIAAVSNNGIGISGIAGGTGGGNGAKIMSCEIFHPTDGHYDANSNATADAIKYAADNGAVICQNSWGYAAGALSYDQWSSADRATKEAIDYFIRYAGMSPDGETQTGPMAGGVVIFAAGNEYSRLASYPAAYDACISVASISCTYEAAWYTNYGSTVDICAPGGGDEANFVNLISYDEGYNLSTIPTNLQNGDSFVYTYANGETETKTIDYVSSTVGYGYMMGTSMACPHVSGVAALIVSQFGAPGFTNEQLKEKLFSTARDIDSYQGTIYNSWDRGTYAGKIGKLVDAGAVLDSGEVPPVSDQPTITPAVGQSDTFSLAENAVKTLTYTLAHYTDWSLNDPTGKIAQSIDGNVVTLTIDASQYAAGSYTAELLAVNGTKTAKRTIAYTVSEGDNPTGISMDFYPNPCTDVLNILPNYSGESTIRIRNSMGTEVMNITLG
ncbi:S8 family peptidase, partial [Alistipes putredinis]